MPDQKKTHVYMKCSYVTKVTSEIIRERRDFSINGSETTDYVH